MTPTQIGIRRNPRFDIRNAASWMVIVTVTAIVLIPFLWMISLAFTPPELAFGSSQFWPDSPTFENFVTAITGANILVPMINSSIIAIVVVAANCVFATMAGYALAKLRFPGDSLVFAALISTAMIPASVTLIPLFLMTKSIPLTGGNNFLGIGGTGLLDSLGGLALPYLIIPLNLFLSRQYFMEFPSELAEAARTDGAGEFRIFFQIYFPLAKPLLAVVGIFSFVGIWDDFLWPLVITTSEEAYTVQLALAKLVSSGNIQYGAAMAAAVLVSLPVLVVFFFNQKAFISGLSEGSVKG